MQGLQEELQDPLLVLLVEDCLPRRQARHSRARVVAQRAPLAAVPSLLPPHHPPQRRPPPRQHPLPPQQPPSPSAASCTFIMRRLPPIHFRTRTRYVSRIRRVWFAACPRSPLPPAIPRGLMTPWSPPLQMRPFRAQLTHELLVHFGIYENHLEPMRPRLVTRTDLGQYHSDNYLALLQICENYLSEEEASAEGWDGLEKSMSRFNLGTPTNPLFLGMYEYCRTFVTGSLGGAAKLNEGIATTAINWFGGMHHAKRTSASGGCYVNDCVLAILELLKVHARVLYVDLDFLHGDAVEEAFYTTNRVLTLSFHRRSEQGMFPGTGHEDDIGFGQGKDYAVNVPLESGTDDATFVPLFKSIVEAARVSFFPEAVVVQCGAAGLAGDQLGDFNLTVKCVLSLIRQCKLWCTSLTFTKPPPS